MKAVISADWHIDKNNRFEDMEVTLKELTQHVIGIKPKYFIFLGDAFKNWRPIPMELALFRHHIQKIAEAGIKVLILVGNHDYPESEDYRGYHCFSEFYDWSKYQKNIEVIDNPNVMKLSDKASGIFIPHIPKNKIEKSYEDSFEGILSNLLAEMNKDDAGKPKRMLFSHVYLQEAKVGAGDININTANGVSVGTIKKHGIDTAFLGDIHKSQRIEPGYFYPGSIERVDFGEKDDIKGFIVYDDETDGVEFIHLNSRSMVDMVINLVDHGFYKTGKEADKQPAIPIKIDDVEDYIEATLTQKKKALKNAIVKIKMVCTKEQKAVLDNIEEKTVKALLDTYNVHRLKSIGYEIVDAISVRNAEVNESLTPVLALHKYVGMKDYSDDAKKYILMAGEKIIKG